MKNLFKLFFIILYISCNSTSVSNKQGKNNFDSSKKNIAMDTITDLHSIRKYVNINFESTDKDYYYKGVPILLKRLKNAGYKFPDGDTFRKIILRVFKIDVDTAQTDNISYLDGTFKIFRKDGFVLFSDLYNETEFQNIPRTKDMFLQLNMYLFNNSVEARTILIQNKPEALTSLVFDLGYGIVEDSVIADAYFKEVPFGTYRDDQLTYLLCNQKNDKISGLRVELAGYLAKHYPDIFSTATMGIIDPEPTEQDIYGYSFLNNDVKYKCWGQIVDIGWRIHDISYFVGVFETHKNLSAFYKKHNYCGLKGLERFCQLYDKYGVEDPNKFQPQDEFWNEAPYKVE